MESFDTLYNQRYEAAKTEAETTVVLFKEHARQAFRTYAILGRSQTTHLTSKTTEAYSFYKGWYDTLLPKLQFLDDAPKSEALRKILKESLSLNKSEVEEIADKLAEDRSRKLKKQLVANYYGPSECGRQIGWAFLNRPHNENIVMIQRYLDFLAYKKVAKEYKLAVYDRWAPYPVRFVQHLRDRAQTKKFIVGIQHKIKSLDEKVKELEAMDCNLMSSILALSIDLITIGSARKNYEKMLGELSVKQQNSPTKRLELYKDVTAKLHPSYLESAVGIESIRTIQQTSQEIDNVLMRVFDLPTRNYNELMGRMKSYRELTRERETLRKLISA